jgi:hypothetical protein
MDAFFDGLMHGWMDGRRYPYCILCIARDVTMLWNVQADEVE